MKYIENDLLYAVGNSITGRVRSANEDNCGYGNTPNGHLFVVCDGMGGHVGGAVASKIAVDSILEYFSRFKYSDIPLAVSKALEYANIQILGKAKENPELSGMGTTACVLLVEDDKVWIGVPGIYHEKEKIAAGTFGFEEFRRLTDVDIDLEENERNTYEDFGYWCRQISDSSV